MNRLTGRGTDCQTNGQLSGRGKQVIDRWSDRQTEEQTVGQTGRQAEEQMDGQTDRGTGC